MNQAVAYIANYYPLLGQLMKLQLAGFSEAIYHSVSPPENSSTLNG